MKQIVTLVVCMTVASLLLLSCGNKSKDKSIVGKWTFDKSMVSDKTDPVEAQKKDDRKKDIVAEFSENGNYFSINTGGSSPDTMEKGTYQVAGNGKFIVTQRTGSTRIDSVKILELSDKVLKVLSPDNDTILLKRIQ